MSAEPTPAEEPDETDVVSQKALDARLELNRRSLKREWDDALSSAVKGIVERINAEREATKQTVRETIDKAIRELKSDLETARRDHERAESETKWKRQEEWFRRLTCGVIGAVASFLFFIIVSQCTSNIRDVERRISTLESKQPK